MKGPEGTRDACAQLMRDALGLKVAALRTAYGIGSRDLPDIRNVSSGELAEQVVGNLQGAYVEIVNARLMPGMQWVDMQVGYPVYRLRYSLRLYVWALGDTWPGAIDRRDNATNAVRQTLLEYPTLTTVPGDSGRLLHHDTYTEEYGAPVRTGTQSGHTWAGAMCSADVWSEETMTAGALRPPIGETERTQLGMTVLGVAEEMPEDLPLPGDFTPVLDATEAEPVTEESTDGS